MIDLHTHSTVSDGSDPPEQVVGLAGSAGLTAMALTDHDRLDGIPAAQARARQVGVELVSGCELSLEHPGTLHLLVFFVEPGDGPLQDELRRLQEARSSRNRRLVARLEQLGLPVTAAELEAESGGSGAGRPHVASILVKKGVVDSIQEAFDTWLAKGRPAYVDKERLHVERALALARASGGVAVLAHPLSLGLALADLDSTVASLAAIGLAGVEGIYGRYSPAERELVSAVGRRHGLVVTGGSDYHGAYKPDLAVGTGRGDLHVPDVVLDQLRERAAVA